jgi:sulfur carrier protein ThiS
MKVFLINNDGGGFADHVVVADGTTISQLFANTVRNGDPTNFLIRVNREAVASTYVLREGDRVTITSRKYEGA